MLEDWLTIQPGGDLLDTWKDYIRALCETLTAETKENLQTQIITRARSVAEATGGILGLGNKISSSEQSVLDDLSAAFG